MSCILLATLLATYSCYVNGQSKCTTPSGVVGTCMSIYQCDVLLDLINKKIRSSDDINLLHKSQCGIQGTIPSLCCPETCYTPENQPGSCTSIFRCPHLLNLLRLPVSQETMQYLLFSRCVDSKQYSVCCGPPPILSLGPTTVVLATDRPPTPAILLPDPPKNAILTPNPAPPATVSTTNPSMTPSSLLLNPLSPILSLEAPSSSSVEDLDIDYQLFQSPCLTPGGEAGMCMFIHECDTLVDLLLKTNRTSEETDLLNKSKCGVSKTSLTVCCPDPCFTPDGQLGKCISIHSCPHIVSLLIRPASKESIQYVRNSRCQSLMSKSVCCGPTPNLSPPPIGNCSARVSAFPPDHRTECCGVDSSVDGERVAPGATRIYQYPWLVIIEYKFRKKIGTLCFGTLISGKYVVSTCHCVNDNVFKPKNIRLGEYNRTNEGPDCVPLKSGGMECTEGAIVIPVEEITPHPNYDRNNPTAENDISLIRMQRMAPFTDFIRPICLPHEDVTISPRTNITLYVTGWGYASKKNPNSQIKLHVDLPYIDLETCKARYSTDLKNIILESSKYVCAGGVLGKDTCQGDSGSPLMYQKGRTYEMIGITSYGVNPCGTNIPGVYTKIYEHNPWIMMNIRP